MVANKVARNLKMWLILAILPYILLQVDYARAHGRLMDPPARNAMWRFGFPTHNEYNDNELNCGGFGAHYEINGGKCGVCGDRWDHPPPRFYESGGIAAEGFLGRRYTPGQIIDVEIALTANHKGYFELRLCPLDGDPTVVERQECFNKYPLYLEGRSSYRFYIPEDSAKNQTFNYRVKLPDGVTCSQCVIQWIYKTANTWGLCDDGSGALGCGNQEMYRNCADVAIITNTHQGSNTGGLVPTSLEDNPYAVKISKYNATSQIFQEETLVNRYQVCVANGRNKNVPQYDNWCMRECLKYPPNCPDNICTCLTGCVPTGSFAKEEGADVFCHINCLRYPPNEKCPEWCQCT